MSECISHHLSCECREALYAELKAEVDQLRAHIARFDPPTVAAMLDAIEAAEVEHDPSGHGGNELPCDVCFTLARVYTLIGDERE